MRLQCFQHVTFETPGSIVTWAEQGGHVLSYTRFYEPAPQFPDLADLDGLLVLGGAMGVHDDAIFPWLRAEKVFISQAVAAGKAVLGICLGAQLLANVLGAAVTSNPLPEIGFFPVQFTAEARQHSLLRHLPATASFLHWHGDTFAVPAGAVPVGSSAACRNQGFVFGERVVGLQFHPEMTTAILEQLIAHDGHELVPGPHVQSAQELQASSAHLRAGRELLFPLLDALANGAEQCSARRPQAIM